MVRNVVAAVCTPALSVFGPSIPSVVARVTVQAALSGALGRWVRVESYSDKGGTFARAVPQGLCVLVHCRSLSGGRHPFIHRSVYRVGHCVCVD